MPRKKRVVPVEKPLPQVWQITLYSKEEVVFASIAIAHAMTQIVAPDNKKQLFEQMELQLLGLDKLATLSKRMGFAGVNTLRKRFAAVADTVSEKA